jgi:hypothetical protein
MATVRIPKSVTQADLFGKARRRPRLPRNEEAEQTAFLERLALTHPVAAEHTFAIPNGGRRGKFEAHRLVLAGVRAGVPDLMLALPVGAYHGLFIEMKPTGATWCDVRTEQRLWLSRLNAVGYRAVVAYGWDMARELVDEYVGHD